MVESIRVSRHGTGEEAESLHVLTTIMRQRELTGNIVDF